MKHSKTERVVIVGGGFGGLKAAMKLANKPGFEVILMSEGANFEYHGALYRSVTGHSPLEVAIPIDDILHRAKNVKFVLDKATKIDPKKNIITGETGNTYKYDKAVLAMGNVVNYLDVKGMEDNSFAMSTIAQTVMLRNRMTELFKKPPKDLTIAIVGAGPSGVELAGAIPGFAELVAKKYGKKIAKPRVVLIEGADRVLPMFDPVLSGHTYKRLQQLGVTLRLNTKVNACEEGKVCVSDGDIKADLIVWTAGNCASDFYVKHPKVFKLAQGHVLVDKYLRIPGHTNIYVIGDNAYTPFTGMAQTALHDARFVAHNLVREHYGTKMEAYRPLHPTYVVPVGDKWAVLQNQQHQWSGRQAWAFRRQADRAILRNFLPLKQALKRWRKGNQLTDF